MTYDQLDDFKKELVGEAYQADLTWRIRLVIAVPICAAVVAVIWWFVARDGDSYGVGLVEFVAAIFVVILGWMAFQAISARRVKWAIRSFDLDPAAAKELVASLATAPGLEPYRLGARSAIGAELEEGTRQTARVVKSPRL